MTDVERNQREWMDRWGRPGLTRRLRRALLSGDVSWAHDEFWMVLNAVNDPPLSVRLVNRAEKRRDNGLLAFFGAACTFEIAPGSVYEAVTLRVRSLGQRDTWLGALFPPYAGLPARGAGAVRSSVLSPLGGRVAVPGEPTRVTVDFGGRPMFQIDPEIPEDDERANVYQYDAASVFAASRIT